MADSRPDSTIPGSIAAKSGGIDGSRGIPGSASAIARASSASPYSAWSSQTRSSGSLVSVSNICSIIPAPRDRKHPLERSPYCPPAPPGYCQYMRLAAIRQRLSENPGIERPSFSPGEIDGVLLGQEPDRSPHQNEPGRSRGEGTHVCFKPSCAGRNPLNHHVVPARLEPRWELEHPSNAGLVVSK